MRYVSIKGFKDNKEIEIKLSSIMMGSGDFLREDNLEFAGPILDKYVELGGNCFDTARHYRHSETALRTWMKEKNNRDEMVIFTKGCHPVREFSNVPRVTAEAIRVDVEESLDRLGTDHVELFALHRDDINYPVGPIMTELDKIVKEGKIYAIGVSNWKLDRIKEANNYAKKHNLTPITFNSPNLSLAKCKVPRWAGCISADDEMLRWHEENNIALISWSSQAGGFFSGKYSPKYREEEEMVEVFYTDENWERYNRAEKLAVEKGMSTIQMALAYVVNQNFPAVAVVGPEKMDELLSSYRGALIDLTEEQVKWLNLK